MPAQQIAIPIIPGNREAAARTVPIAHTLAVSPEGNDHLSGERRELPVFASAFITSLGLGLLTAVFIDHTAGTVIINAKKPIKTVLCRPVIQTQNKRSHIIAATLPNCSNAVSRIL
jgi:hypothetical protein